MLMNEVLVSFNKSVPFPELKIIGVVNDEELTFFEKGRQKTPNRLAFSENVCTFQLNLRYSHHLSSVTPDYKALKGLLKVGICLVWLKEE